MIPPSPIDPRRLHYGEFYGERPYPGADGRPRIVVVGNCQAESLRILLDSTGEVSSFRVPAIHEWTEEDVSLAQKFIAQADFLIMQPVRPDYRNLPCGTGQLTEHLPPHGKRIGFPVLRFDGLMPYHAIIRSPKNPSLNPPLIPYHDLRILTGRDADPSAETLRLLAQDSIQQLRTREQAHHTVTVSDYLEQTPVWHTINHPDNATLAHLATRVLEAMGIAATPSDPGRELLGGLDAGVDKHAAEALGVTVTGRDSWSPEPEGWREAHREFYAQHPDVVEAGLKRHARRLELLGLVR